MSEEAKTTSVSGMNIPAGQWTVKAFEPPNHKPAGAALYTALNEACSKVKRIGKDGHNTHHNYDYTSAEAIIEYSGQLLADAGVVAVRTKYTVGEMIEDQAPAKVWNGKETPGQETFMRMITSTFRVTHAETGETEFCEHPFPAILVSGKPWDKAIAAGLTTGLSYFLRDLLRIPRADCPDTMDQRDDRTEADHQQRRDNHAQKQQKAPVKKSKKVKKKTTKKKEEPAPVPLDVRITNAIEEAKDTVKMNAIFERFGAVRDDLTKEKLGEIESLWTKKYDILLANEENENDQAEATK